MKGTQILLPLPSVRSQGKRYLAQGPDEDG